MSRQFATGDLPIRLAAIWCLSALSCLSCSEISLALKRSRYDYKWERQKCLTLVDGEERDTCLGDVEKAEKIAAYPGYFVSERSEAQLKKERQAFQEHEREQLLTRCRSAADAVRTALRDGKSGDAYRITQESNTCPQADAIREVFLAEVRKLSPQQVAAQQNEDIALVYWRPIELSEWVRESSEGTFVTDRGVYIVGLVEQQFDGFVILQTNIDLRVALRLDRPRYIQQQFPIYVIARFSELGRFNTALGARADIPVFDLVFDASH